MSNLLSLKAIEHFVVVLVVAFAAQVTVAGAPVDLSSAAGRTAVVTAVAMAFWRVLRENLQPTATPTGTSTGSTTGA